MKNESSTAASWEANSKLIAVLVGTLIGWPLRSTVVWALLLWAGPPLALTWFQCLLLVGILDFLRAE